MCELTLAVSHPPTGEEQVVHEEPQSEEVDMRHEANKRGGVGCSSDNKVYRPNEVKLREKKNEARRVT